MPRIRSLKPEFWSSPGNRGTDPWVRLLYQAMWNWADDYGIGTLNIRELAGFAFPHEDDPIAPTSTELPCLLAEVQNKYSVVFYEVSGRRYYAITSWEDHNRNERRAKSRHPGPGEGTPFDPGPSDQGKRESTEDECGTSDGTHGSSVRTHGGSGTGTGEPGNRGSKNKDMATEVAESAIVLEMPSPKPAAYSEAFEQAWVAYGRKGAKKTSYAEWQRVARRADLKTVVAAIPAYVASTPNLKYRKDFERWLKGDCWESVVVADQRPAAGGYLPFQNPTDDSVYDEPIG